MNNTEIQKINSITEIQQAIKDVLTENTYFAKHGCNILIENQKDIEYQIKNSIGKIGIVGCVVTPTLTFNGDYISEDGRQPFWKMDACSVVFIETPTLNRERANYCTALDAALQAAESFAGLLAFNLEDITQSASQGTITVTLRLKTDAIFRFVKE